MPDSDTRVCPYCAETIKAAAIKCKHCGSEVSHSAALSSHATSPKLAASDVEGLLTLLVDKSLALYDQETGRYRLMESIRQYALERRPAERDVRDRHMAWYLAFAEAGERGLQGAGQKEWLNRLETEHDNLRLAERWSVDSGAVETGLRLVAALQMFYYAMGYFAEGRGLLDEVLSLPQQPEGAGRRPGDSNGCGAISALDNARIRALHSASVLASNQGDHDAALALVEEGLARARALADRWNTARCLNWIGYLRVNTGHHGEGRQLLEESLAIWRDLDDTWQMGWPLVWLGWFALQLGELDVAVTRLDEAYRLWRRLGDRWGACFALQGLGEAAAARGMLDVAMARHTESLAMARDVGHKPLTSRALYFLANTSEKQGDTAAALRFLEERDRVERELGRPGYRSAARLASVARAGGNLQTALGYARDGLSEAAAAGDGAASVALLEEIAAIRMTAGAHAAAARLLGAAASARAEVARHQDVSSDDGKRSALKLSLGETAFTAVWAEGAAMSLDHAIQLALGQL